MVLIALVGLGQIWSVTCLAEFKVGFDEADITPSVETFTDSNSNGRYEQGEDFTDLNHNGVFDPVWIAGTSTRLARTAYDPLSSIALVLDSQGQGQGTRIAIVSLDVIGLMRPDVLEIQNRLPEAWNIDHLYISSTHNHNGPDLLGLFGPDGETGVDPAYKAFLAEQILKSVKEAVSVLSPARMQVVKVPIVPGDQALDTRPPSVMDSDIRLLHFKQADGDRTIGTLINWSTHVETAGYFLDGLTADFPAALRKALRQGLYASYQEKSAAVEAAFRRNPLLKNGLGEQHIFVAGMVGGMITSTRPHVFLDEDGNYLDHLDNSVSIFDRFSGRVVTEPSLEKAQIQGRMLATEILEVLNSVPEQFDPDVPLKAYQKLFKVPLDNQGLRSLCEARIFAREDGDGCSAFTTEVNIVQIGRSWVVTLPGEIYPEMVLGGEERLPGADFPAAHVAPPLLAVLSQHLFGTDIAAPGKDIFWFGLTNDCLGYFIPKSGWDASEPHNYYVDSSSPWTYGEASSMGPETGVLVTEAIKELVKVVPRASD